MSPDASVPESLRDADSRHGRALRRERVRRLGVIRNSNSQRNRARRVDDLPRSSGLEIVDIAPRSVDDLPAVVAEMRARGIQHIAVDGGDGTLREVMSALPPAYGTRLPTLTLLAGGNANLTSADVGTPGHGPQAMAALVDALLQPEDGPDGATRVRRRPVEVRWPDGSHAPVLGFFIGAAGFYRGWKIAAGTLRDRGILSSAGVTTALIAAAWQTIAGGARNEWQAGMPMDVTIDDRGAPEGPRFLFLTTSLHRLFGNLWPFFGHGDHTLRWLDLDAPPPRFALALPSLLRGKPKPWVLRSGAYRSGGAEHIELRLESPLVIDGEAFTPGAYGIVELHAGPEIEFYTPQVST